jgi:uncharacterized protein (TIGR04255 family)
MTETRHPRYPHPVVLEAFVEVFFAFPPEKPWQPSFFGEFIKRVQIDFPTIEPVVDMGIQIGVSPAGINQMQLPAQQKFRFHHATKPVVLQLSDTAFSVHLLPPYPGWEVVIAEVEAAWSHFVEALHPASINRLNLRYLNRIPMTHDAQRPSHWLKANDYISSVVLESEPAFFSRAEARFDEWNVCIVTLGYLPPTEEARDAPFGAILLDIYRISGRVFSPEKEALIEEVNNLHVDVWNVFDAAKAAPLEELMKGR